MSRSRIYTKLIYGRQKFTKSLMVYCREQQFICSLVPSCFVQSGGLPNSYNYLPFQKNILLHLCFWIYFWNVNIDYVTKKHHHTECSLWVVYVKHSESEQNFMLFKNIIRKSFEISSYILELMYFSHVKDLHLIKMQSCYTLSCSLGFCFDILVHVS